MNAYVAKDQQASLGNLTYVDNLYDEPEAATKPESHGIGHWLTETLARIGEWRRHRQVVEEMALMSDRELADIGLSRSDMARVFNADFVVDHRRGRDYIAF